MSAADRAVPDFEQSIARLRDSWLSLLGAGMPGAAEAPRAIAHDVQGLQQNMLGFFSAFAEPLALFAESQRELSEKITQWAKSQHELAELADAWAESQRKLSDALSAWAPPRNPP